MTRYLTVLAAICLAAPAARAASLTANTLDDSGAGTCTPDGCTLRDALSVAQAGDTVVLDAGIHLLTQGELVVSKAVTIKADGATVSAGGLSRLFRIDASGHLTLDGGTYSGGAVAGPELAAGGAAHVADSATLVVKNATLADNAARGQSGEDAPSSGSGSRGGDGGGPGGAPGTGSTNAGTGGFGGGGGGSGYPHGGSTTNGSGGAGGFGGGGGGAARGVVAGQAGEGGEFGGAGGATGSTNGTGGGGGGAGLGGAIFVAEQGLLVVDGVTFNGNLVAGGGGGAGNLGGGGGGGGAALGANVFVLGTFCEYASVAGGPGAATAGLGGAGGPGDAGGWGGGARGSDGTAVVGAGGVVVTGVRGCPVGLSLASARAFAIASTQVVALVVRATGPLGDAVAEAATVTVDVLVEGVVVGSGAGRVAAGRANVFVELDAGLSVGTHALVARLTPEPGSDFFPGEVEATLEVVDAPIVTRLSEEAANDETCPHGGVRIESGRDTGADGGWALDGALQNGEVDALLTRFLCDGADGADGDNGLDAPATLVTTADVDPGNECAAGGTRVEAGLDNGDGDGVANDGVLQEGEVDVTTVVCNGVDGAKGDDGAAGVDGRGGVDGADGAKGEDGKDGLDGKDAEGGCSTFGLGSASLLGLALVRRRRK